MATSYVIPPGYSPSRYTITTDDHSGWAVVASSISLMVALFFGFIIVCYRYMAGRFAGRNYDACIVTFMIFALPQSVFVISAASQSLGKSTSLLDTNVQTETEQLLYASDLLYLITVSLSRFAVILLQHAVFGGGGKHKGSATIWYSMGPNFVVMVASVLMIALGCDNRSPWLQYSNGCDSMDRRWIITVCSGILLELYMASLVATALSKVEMTTKRKFMAWVPFAMRLSIIGLSVFRLTKLLELRSSLEPMFDRVLVVALTQAEQALSLIGAIIPTIKPFLNDFNTRARRIQQRTQQTVTGTPLTTFRTLGSPSVSRYGSEENII